MTDGLLEFSHSENSPFIRQRCPRLRNVQFSRSSERILLYHQISRAIKGLEFAISHSLSPPSRSRVWKTSVRSETRDVALGHPTCVVHISRGRFRGFLGSDRRYAPRYATGRRRAALVFETRERRYLPVA